LFFAEKLQTISLGTSRWGLSANGNSRQGSNLQEYALTNFTTNTITNVNPSNFGKLFSCAVDAAIYAQPLWVANLTIGGVRHNVVYLATQHDTEYAFDVDANPCTVLCHRFVADRSEQRQQLLPSGQTWATSIDSACGDLQPDIGIVGRR
jgi:hypothetical protein